VAEGKGAVNALDSALRKALYRFSPARSRCELIDYKERVPTRGGQHGRSGARADRNSTARALRHRRRLDEHHRASWQALVDAIEYKLLRPARGGLTGALAGAAQRVLIVLAAGRLVFAAVQGGRTARPRPR
jgi:hypothetical protein